MEEFFEKYNDEQNIDIFPDGKIFRISYDSSVRKLKIVCKKYELFEDLRKSFSAPNQASFFMSRYGYKIEDKVYAINKFGYFSSGLVFDVLDYIKQTYGSTSVLAISKNCLQYILDNITPLKSELQNKDKLVANIADDVGRNNELIKNGKHAFEYRDYQKNAISYLIYNGYGRGLIEIPTAGGKSFILANFIWNILKYYDRKLKTLILVPNKQLVEQFYKDLIDYGYSQYELTRFTAGLKKHEAFNPDAKIIIANRQYIFKNINKLPKVDILIADECLPGETKIQTINGLKEIKDIKINDLVLSFNEKENIYEYKPVEKIHKNLYTSQSYNEFIEITLENNNKLKLTPNHKVFTKNRGYIRADQLTFDDELISY